MQNKLIQRIVDHAARVFPQEACGFILNVSGEVFIKECENLSHTPESSFLIDPMEFAQYSAQITAVYHSHPNRLAEPSLADIASSERANVPFLILSYPSEQVFAYTPTGQVVIPYENRPFVYGVLDCLSLVTDYYLQELSIRLPQSGRKEWEWWLKPENANSFIAGFKSAGFYEVTSLEKGDVIIMQIQSVCPNHAAVYLGDSRILHHPGVGNLSVTEMYGHYWRQNTCCYLRHKEAGTYENN